MVLKHDGYFVGAMPPVRFLEDFMASTKDHLPTPRADFSRVALQTSVPDMCTRLLQAVDKAQICLGLRLYRTRTKNQWLNEANSESPNPLDSSKVEGKVERQQSQCQYGRWPAVGVRMRPRPRKGTKKRIDFVEPYNYSTAILGIEVQHRREADPFSDPQDPETDNAYDKRSTAPSPDQCPLPPPSTIPIMQTPHRPDKPSTPGVVHRPLAAVCSPNQPDPLYSTPQVKLEPQRSPMRLPVKPEPTSPICGFYPLFENPALESAAFRASLAEHAAEHFTRQQRTCFFQVVIFGRWARFLRWDRSGAISTERFDYVACPDLLSEFLWRFNHMSDEQRGLDPTATLAGPSEKRLFTRAVREFTDDLVRGHKDGVLQRPIQGAVMLLDDMPSWPVWKVRVVDATTKRSTDLLIGRPLSNELRVFGRATRAYIAYDLREERLVFLKDTWRIDHQNLRVESTTYRALKKNNVPHIPDLLYGGDVRNTRGRVQETLARNYADVDDEWRITNALPHIFVHHRIVQDIVYSLEGALGVQEFIQAIHDVLLAMQKAHDSARLLHRDLSIGNMMIDSNGRGVLNDWDQAGSLDEPAPGVGTRQFMSIPMLSERGKNHDIADDLESVYWVLLFGAMHMFTPPDKDIPLEIFDDEGVDHNGHLIGGNAKKNWLRDPGGLRALELPSPELRELLLDSQKCWLMFHLARDGSVDRDKDLQDEAKKVLELASDPSFWIDKYQATLQSFANRERTLNAPSALEPHTGASVNHASPTISTPGNHLMEPTEDEAKKRDPPHVKGNAKVNSTTATSRKRRVEDMDPDFTAPLVRSQRLRRSCRKT
ncbi:hypothetical protein PHLGIDRAFT_37885 [Phlebiopsis gigantea 11061_1 CR5-6]|uniref:Protein kinase domain-containing protein n=1 Tax=Phlebiopsis gigantea (strain 11061_1 CR5-6) TaxID=745531 RepID=A0A0C3ND77_PHLG1|nr:hypothetical protein PHLGIDRAFT_37885 [Phlebiopsis gigantea 11061_1 CR5-6]